MTIRVGSQIATNVALWQRFVGEVGFRGGIVFTFSSSLLQT